MNVRDSEEGFDDWMNELYALVQVGECWFEPAKVLKLCDEVTYDVWYWNWAHRM